MASVQDSIRQGVHDIEAFIGRVSDLGLEVDPAWHERLASVSSRIDERPEVSVALLGGTGAGKSTLVNAIAEERLLPVNSMRVTTAAITEVSYGEGDYVAEIEFVDRESWRDELEYLAEDIFDTRAELGEDEVDLGISRAAEDKVRLVYGDANAELFFASLDMGDLEEPEAIATAFSEGTQQVRSDDPKEFRELIKNYLDAKAPFWPIVKRMRVRGPFPKLIDGAVLVDLPGLNDPNTSREQATREHLESAQFVWVVFNMKRALTREIFEFLRDEDLLRRLFIDGRTGSMTLVGTASDDIDYDHDLEQFNLDEDAEIMDIIAARNSAVEHNVRLQLSELSTLLAREAREKTEAAAGLVTQVNAAPVFCVSARDYQKCVGLMRRVQQVITEVDDTGIPDLQDHLVKTVSALGQKAHLDRLVAELELVRSDALRLVRSRLGAIRAERETTAAQLEEVRAAARQAHTFLGDQIGRGADGFRHAMDTASQLLGERLRSSTITATSELRELRDRWGSMHWNTLKATVRRGGRWVSGTRRIDIPNQIASPMVKDVTFAWVDFFGTKSEAAVEVLENTLRSATEAYLDSFEREFARAPALKSLFDDYGRGVSETTAALIADEIDQLRGQIKERLAADRRQLYEQVTDQVSTEMQTAFRVAAQESGRGMRDRMVDTIYSAAYDTADLMFSDVNQRLDELLRSLLRFMDKRVDQLLDELKREAGSLVLLVERSVSDGHGTQSISEHEKQLETLERQTPQLNVDLDALDVPEVVA